MNCLEGWYAITAFDLGVVIGIKTGHGGDLFLCIALLLPYIRKILGDFTRKVVLIHVSIVPDDRGTCILCHIFVILIRPSI